MTNHFGELLQDHVHFKWITTPGQSADTPGQTLLTREHSVIRAWALARHAEPATGRGKVDINDGGAAVRFAFPGVGRLQPISWDDWFEDFDQHSLVFAYEERTNEGVQSNRYRLVSMDELRKFADEVPVSAADGEAAEEPRSTAEPAGAGHRSTPQPSRGWRRAFDFFNPRRS